MPASDMAEGEAFDEPPDRLVVTPGAGPVGHATSLGLALSITLVPLAPAGPPAVGTAARGSAAADLLDTLAAFATRYGGAVLVLWPRPPRPPPSRRHRSEPHGDPDTRDARAQPDPALTGASGRSGAGGPRAADGAQLAPVEHGLFQLPGGSARRTAGSPRAGRRPASPARPP